MKPTRSFIVEVAGHRGSAAQTCSSGNQDLQVDLADGCSS